MSAKPKRLTASPQAIPRETRAAGFAIALRLGITGTHVKAVA